MPKSYYLPSDETGQSNWLTNLGNKLPTYHAALGLTAAEVAATQADAAYFGYVLQAQSEVASYSQQWTAYKKAARNGTGPSLGVAPVAPVMAAAPAAVAPGIISRAIALVARIKVAPGYTEAIGQALGLIGAEQTVNVTTLKPVLTADLEAGQVTVGWTKQGMDGIEIHVDRGDGKGFVFLAIDSIPDYTDTAPLPAAGQSALWKYMAIYKQNDDRVGQWSDVVSLAVAGA